MASSGYANYIRNCRTTGVHYLHPRRKPVEENDSRASVSISSNIAEGFERASKKDLTQFLYIAKGSVAEVRSQLFLAFELNHITKLDLENLSKKSIELSKQLGAFIANIKS